MNRVHLVLFAALACGLVAGSQEAVAADPQGAVCLPSTPTPTPIPAPSPAAAPGATPSAGATPGATGVGGATGGGAGAGGATGGGLGRGAQVRKAKFSRSQSFWLSASKLPWETCFLPLVKEDGYAGTEVDLDAAINGRGNQGRWTLDRRPTLLVVYQPDNGRHITLMGEIESDARFLAASRFFKLIKLDWDSIRTKKTRQALRPKKAPVFYIYDQDRKLVQRVTKARSSSLLKFMCPLMDRFYDQPSAKGILEMGKIVARRAWVENRLAAWSPKVICPDCGVKFDKAVKKLASLRKEAKELDDFEKALLTPKSRPSAR